MEMKKAKGLIYLRTRCKSPWAASAMRSMPVTAFGQGYWESAMVSRKREVWDGTYADTGGLCVEGVDAGGRVWHEGRWGRGRKRRGHGTGLYSSNTRSTWRTRAKLHCGHVIVSHQNPNLEILSLKRPTVRSLMDFEAMRGGRFPSLHLKRMLDTATLVIPARYIIPSWRSTSLSFALTTPRKTPRYGYPHEKAWRRYRSLHFFRDCSLRRLSRWRILWQSTCSNYFHTSSCRLVWVAQFTKSFVGNTRWELSYPCVCRNSHISGSCYQPNAGETNACNHLNGNRYSK